MLIVMRFMLMVSFPSCGGVEIECGVNECLAIYAGC